MFDYNLQQSSHEKLR